MDISTRISLRSRQHKLRLFLRELQPGPETTVLDVGAGDLGFGEDGRWELAAMNFFEEFYRWPDRITALGLGDGDRFRRRYPGIAYVQGDGCELPFADGAFDLVFSNAVIEHVGDRARQQRFVAEALRVARGVFLTTPNRCFPLELHTRLPLVHWLPPACAGPIYDLARKPWAREITPLGPRALRSLFPADHPAEVRNLGLTLAAIVRPGAR